MVTSQHQSAIFYDGDRKISFEKKNFKCRSQGWLLQFPEIYNHRSEHCHFLLGIVLGWFTCVETKYGMERHRSNHEPSTFSFMTEKESVDPRSGAFDRGPTPYFHGRSSILTDFRKTLSNVQTSEKGTVHLVYGAPGSGKSALLHECKKIAMRDQWESIYITVGALWNPDKLLNALGIDKKYK